MQKFLLKTSPSPDQHRTNFGEASIEPRHHLSSTARTQAANTKYTVIASPAPSLSPALLVPVPQKARPSLNFEPGRAAGPELCISTKGLRSYGDVEKDNIV